MMNDVFMDYIDDSMYSKAGMKLVIQTLEDMTYNIQKLADEPHMEEWCKQFHLFVDSVLEVSRNRIEPSGFHIGMI